MNYELTIETSDKDFIQRLLGVLFLDSVGVSFTLYCDGVNYTIENDRG